MTTTPRRTLLPLLVILFSVLTFSSCSSLINIDKVLEQVATELNASCPMDVDAETRMDSVEALPNRTLQYNYTLLKYVKDDFSPELLTQIEDTMKPQVLESLKGSDAMETLRTYEVTFVYIYNGSDGQEIYRLTIAPDDYK